MDNNSKEERVNSRAYAPLMEEVARWKTSCAGQDVAISAQQYLADVQEMCGLLRPVKKERELRPIHHLLHHWYAPRNEEHTRHYMGRCAVLGSLQDKIMDCVEKRKEKR